MDNKKDLNFKMNIYQSLNRIKELTDNSEIKELCDNIRIMCEDTFNGFISENLELYERLERSNNS